MPQQITGARTRLKFEDFSHQAQPDGRCRISVRLEWDGQVHQRASEALETSHGRLMAAANATLSAVASVASETELQMVGIKSVRAFDGWVVVTRINGTTDGVRSKLLGSAPCETEDELPKAAARAVLNALNRVVETYVP